MLWSWSGAYLFGLGGVMLDNRFSSVANGGGWEVGAWGALGAGFGGGGVVSGAWRLPKRDEIRPSIHVCAAHPALPNIDQKAGVV